MSGGDMTERRNTEWWKLVLQIGVLVVGLIGAYYQLDARVQVAESRIDQETKGYSVLQEGIHKRLDRLEEKLDRVIERGIHP